MQRVSPLQLLSSESSKYPDLQLHMKEAPSLIQIWSQSCIPSSQRLIAVHEGILYFYKIRAVDF